MQETWHQWTPKDSNSSAKGLLSFSGIIKKRKKMKSCAQAETDDHVLNETARANAFSESGPLLCYLLPGWGAWGSELDMCDAPRETLALDDEPSHVWKGSAEALFSLEMRCSSQVLCLQAAHNVPCFQFAPALSTFCSSIFLSPLSGYSSRLPLQQLWVLWRALSLSTLTRSLCCDLCYTRAYSHSRYPI